MENAEAGPNRSPDSHATWGVVSCSCKTVAKYRHFAPTTVTVLVVPYRVAAPHSNLRDRSPNSSPGRMCLCQITDNLNPHIDPATAKCYSHLCCCPTNLVNHEKISFSRPMVAFIHSRCVCLQINPLSIYTSPNSNCIDHCSNLGTQLWRDPSLERGP